MVNEKDPLYYKTKIKKLIQEARANGLEVTHEQRYLVEYLVIKDVDPTTTVCSVQLNWCIVCRYCERVEGEIINEKINENRR